LAVADGYDDFVDNANINHIIKDGNRHDNMQYGRFQAQSAKSPATGT
jgi:hypothetical protein